MKYIYIFVLFLILSSPFMYNLTNKILKNVVKISNKVGRPTFYGLIIHTFIFLLLIRFIFEIDNITEGNVLDKNITSEEIDTSDPSHSHKIDNYLDEVRNIKDNAEFFFDENKNNIKSLLKNEVFTNRLLDNDDLVNNLDEMINSKSNFINDFSKYQNTLEDISKDSIREKIDKINIIDNFD